MNKIIKKSFQFLFWLYIFILLLSNGAKYLDADFGWHLRVGEDISVNKAVPDIEYYDYTLEGQSWVDHEWGLNYVSYLIFVNFGYFSLIVFYAFIALLSFFLLYLFVLKKYKRHFEKNFILNILLLFFILLGVYASFPHLGVRMQEFTFLYTILLINIFDKYLLNKNYKYLIFLPFLFFIWANSHAGFLIGLFLLLMWIGVKYIELLSFKYKQFYFLDYQKVFSNKQLFTIALFTGLSFLATLINPYGIELYSFLNSYSNDFYLKHIVEWLPVYYLPILYKQVAYSILSIVVVIIFLVFSFFPSRKYSQENYKINFWDISIFVLFLYLALKSKRHFPLFFAVSIPFVISIYIKLFNDSFQEIKKLINLRIVSFFAISVLLILIVGQSAKVNFVNNPFNEFCGKFPCGAVDYLEQNKELQEKRIFNDYGWGGYLIWVLPDMKLFIDGRLPQFEYNGQSMLEEYRDFYISETMEEKIMEHNIEMFFIKTSFNYINLNWFEKYFLLLNEEEINTQDNALKKYLDDSDKWSEVYSDEISSIYVKI